MHRPAQIPGRKILERPVSVPAPSCATPSGQGKLQNQMYARHAKRAEKSMDTITTIQSLLMCNGSAQPAMVALTQNELRLIAAAPDMFTALKRLCGETSSAIAHLRLGESDPLVVAHEKAYAAIAKAMGG
jgi:hypothetical protein